MFPCKHTNIKIFLSIVLQYTSQIHRPFINSPTDTDTIAHEWSYICIKIKKQNQIKSTYENYIYIFHDQQHVMYLHCDESQCRCMCVCVKYQNTQSVSIHKTYSGLSVHLFASSFTLVLLIKLNPPEYLCLH